MMIGARTAAWAKSGAPLPYNAEVEYLQSTGTQYIDLCIVGGSEYDVRAEIGFALKATFFAFGSRSEQEFRAFNFLTITNARRFDYGTEQYIIGDTEIGVLKDFNFDHATGAYSYGSIDGLAKKETFSNGLKMILFGHNNGGQIVKSNGVMIGKFYISDGTNTLDLIPVRKDGVGMMYDRVSGELFGNAGTGEFIIGPDKTT